MAPLEPTFVIFDLGNVLVHIAPEAFLQTLGVDTPENRTYYQQKITDIVKAYERGDETTNRFLTRLDELFNSHDRKASHDHGGNRVFSADDFRRAMLSIIGRPVAGMDEIVRSLSARVPLGLLSNTNPLHFDSCMEHLSSLQFIPSHFLSYRLKSLKPDARIFEQAVELLQLDAGDILYIDDIPENIAAAKRVGLNSHLFVGDEELRERLVTLKLL
jgi:putative hydrolase of the HAD superfamily